jgi:hypothetical protein
MTLARICLCAAALGAASPPALAQSGHAQPGVHWDGTVSGHAGPCDASAALAIPEAGFDVFLVANDETERLHAATSGGNAPPRLVGDDLGRYLRMSDGDEADLEGAAWLGGRMYWIASHGRNAKGERQPPRRRFFATTAHARGGEVAVEPVPTADGGPYEALLAALARIPMLAEAIGPDADDPGLAPEKGGLNIEGLAAGRDGRSLLIGFRNPRTPDGRAILVPLANPAEVLAGAAPDLKAPIPLDLGGRGVRSIEFSPAADAYFVVAGPPGDGEGFEVYRWSGRDGDKPAALGVERLLRGIPAFRPEALVVDAGGRRLRLLSDDGDRPVVPPGGTEAVACKKVRPRRDQSFRSIVLELR